MSLIAIGDVHGCAKTLSALLERLRLASDDHVIFVGDYVDRGPDSRGVIELLLELRETQPCTFLRGNHESMMLDFLNYDEKELWEVNGGRQTLESYRNAVGEEAIPETHVTFLRETKYFHDEPDFFFVHAGLKPDLTIAENLNVVSPEVFLWERSHLSHPSPVWEKPVVCGHTPQRSPINRESIICVDTGCVYHRFPGYGYLTAVRLPEREMVFQPYQG